MGCRIYDKYPTLPVYLQQIINTTVYVSLRFFFRPFFLTQCECAHILAYSYFQSNSSIHFCQPKHETVIYP